MCFVVLLYDQNDTSQFNYKFSFIYNTPTDHQILYSLISHFKLCNLDNARNYDTTLQRLCVHESDSWKGIAPSMDGADFNPEPPIFTAKFANCENNKHILAIANEDGKVII